jgi:hypothetical protein
MENEEFAIEFSYKGCDFSGLVISNERNGRPTFIIRYSIEPARQFERTVELMAIVGEGSMPSGWKEVADEIGQRPADKGLVIAIGEALEDLYF